LGAAVLQVVWMYVYPAKALKRAAAFERFGCYREETDGEGAFRWCGPRGSINVPVAVKESDGSRVAALRVAGPPPFPGSSSGALLLEAEGVSLGQWEIVPGRTRLIEIPVTTSGDGLTLDFEIGTGVLPVRDLPPSKDRRFLSFKFRK